MKQSFPGSLALKALRVIVPAVIVLVGIYTLYIAFSHLLIGDQEAFLLMPGEAFCDTPLPVRIAVRRHSTNLPVSHARVSLTLVAGTHTQPLTEGKTDSKGLFFAIVKIPPELGRRPVKFRIAIQSPYGRESFSKPITLKEPLRLALATDKKLYRPGETVIIKSATTDIAGTIPAASKAVSISVKEPGGVTIFTKEGLTQGYGELLTFFPLGISVREGDYRITAKVQGITEEKTISVASLCPSLFTIEMSGLKPFFNPGDLFRGTIGVKKNSGEPAGNVKVSMLLCIHTSEGSFSLPPLKGETGTGGLFSFSTTLPSRFPASLRPGENSSITASVSVQDRQENRGSLEKSFAVSDKPIGITWLPQGLGLVPGFSNASYLITYFPDGTPAPALITVKTKERTVKLHTDRWGIAPFSCDPAKDGKSMEVAVHPLSHESGTTLFELTPAINPISYYARTDRVLYEAGKPIKITIKSNDKNGFISVDLISHGCSEISKTILLKDGIGSDELAIPATFSGPAALQ